jgi:hypothetical protein
MFDKALGQYRFKIRELLEPLNRYGQQVYCQAVEEEFVTLAVQLHYKLIGEDIPYDIHRPTYPP